MRITSYRDLDAWKLAMDLAVSVYRVTGEFPREELYGLTSQVRRAAIGIPSNVGEGHRRGTNSYRYHVTIALGCHAECETQLELALRLHLVPATMLAPTLELAERVGQVLHGLLRSLSNDSEQSRGL